MLSFHSNEVRRVRSVRWVGDSDRELHRRNGGIIKRREHERWAKEEAKARKRKAMEMHIKAQEAAK